VFYCKNFWAGPLQSVRVIFETVVFHALATWPFYKWKGIKKGDWAEVSGFALNWLVMCGAAPWHFK